MFPFEIFSRNSIDAPVGSRFNFYFICMPAVIGLLFPGKLFDGENSGAWILCFSS